MPTMKDLFENLETIRSQGTLLDVRTPEEFAAGHIEGSINISHDELGPRHREELMKAPHLHVYCRRGGRAVYAAEVLKALDIDDFTVYAEDGMEVWMMSGYPTKQG